MSRRQARIAGVLLAAVACAVPAMMIATGELPPCPAYRLHVTGGKWTPHYVSMKRTEFDAYTQAIRGEARGECRVVAQGPATTATRLTPAETAPISAMKGKR